MSEFPPPTSRRPESSGRDSTSAGLAIRIADTFAFSSGLAAAVGASVSLATSLFFGAPMVHVWVLLGATGTFIVYNLDRLRDLERDRETSPIRTAFVTQYRRVLYGLVSVASLALVALLALAPWSVTALCLAIGVVGLLHRRLKRHPALKAGYVSLSWTAVCVGMPWLAAPQADLGLWVAAIFLAAFLANLIASNLRDEEVIGVSGGPRTFLFAARLFVLFAIAIAFAGPSRLHALAWIPACEGVALIFFRPTERYGHLAIDGALLVGALLASVAIEAN